MAVKTAADPAPPMADAEKADIILGSIVQVVTEMGVEIDVSQPYSAVLESILEVLRDARKRLADAEGKAGAFSERRTGALAAGRVTVLTSPREPVSKRNRIIAASAREYDGALASGGRKGVGFCSMVNWINQGLRDESQLELTADEIRKHSIRIDNRR